MEVINFKKQMMTFENQDIRVIAPMDPNEGRRYIDLVKDKFVTVWDHAYNISEYYIHLTPNGELGWRSARSVSSSDPDDALEELTKLHARGIIQEVWYDHTATVPCCS